MSATIHPFARTSAGLRDRVYDLEIENAKLRKKVDGARTFIACAYEYIVINGGDTVLKQMVQEAWEEIEK